MQIALAVPLAPVAAFVLLVNATGQSQPEDASYTAKIREYTTGAYFSTEYVDHLPASDTVPTPLEVLGNIAGAPEILHYSHEVNGYMKRVAEASPRVKVFPMGTSDEGRERILVVVSSDDTIANLDAAKADTARLADPRTITQQEADELIGRVKPIYFLTGGQHSPETGSPEMLMELVYRLAVEETPFVRTIRDNMIVLITPVIEVDGRDKQIDIHLARRKQPNANLPQGLLYWGAYVAHDNNRDGLGIQLEMTRSAYDVILDYRIQVFHDLHESASYLYASTGTGPYNAWIDPIQVDEWHMLAYAEIDELTRQGVPGVYTHGYWDGWGIAGLNNSVNVHNAIGRFYEVQGARDGSNYIVTANANRSWYQPNPPLPEAAFSIRNHVNLSQSGVLVALNHMGKNREYFMRNFYLKSKRSVDKARTEGPAAYVFPADDPRPGQQAMLLNSLQRQGVEVHRASTAFMAEGVEHGSGSYVVRMDQPYSRAADILLDTQYYNPNDQGPSDDVGWTFGPLSNAETLRVEDTSILDVPMTLVEGNVTPTGGVGSPVPTTTVAFLIEQNAEVALTQFRFANSELKIHAAEESFTATNKTFGAGTFIVRAADNGGDLATVLAAEGAKYGLTAHPVSDLPAVPTHEVPTPRVALMHTWTSTQTEGWIRLALDRLGIPYDYISVHEVRDNPDLKQAYDAILFGPGGGNPLGLLRGVTGNRPLPWKSTELTPNLGRQDETDDMRGGLELRGVMNLQNFVEDGGVFIAIGSSAAMPIHFGMVQGVSIRETPNLWARGGVFRTEIADAANPIAYGYGEDLGVSFSNAPVFAAGGGFGRRGRGRGRGATATDAGAGATTARPSGRGDSNDVDIVQGRSRDMGSAEAAELRARGGGGRGRRGGQGRGGRGGGATSATVVLRFSRDPENLLISGGLMHGEELAGAPAVVDAPLGSGHVVLFSFNPFHRAFTTGSYALVFNAMLHLGQADQR